MSHAPHSRSHPAKRRLKLAVLLFAIGLAAAFAVNLVGIHLQGGIEGWQRWLDEHSGRFYVWRLCLYALIVAGWPWARRRRLQREPHAASQLRMIEVLGVAGMVLCEAGYWLR